MSSYERLAASYDELTEDVDYQRRADFLERLFQRARLPVQALKVLVGLITLGLVMTGLKALAGDSLLLALPRYLLIVLYASAGYPALMKRVLRQGRARR